MLKVALVVCFVSLLVGSSNAYATNTVVGGTISLPSSVAPYSDNKWINVQLMTGWTGTYFRNNYFCTSVMLPANQETIAYQCSIPGLTGEFGIYVQTEFGPDSFHNSMPGINVDAYYNSTGTTADFLLGEHFSAGGTYLEKDIRLIPTLVPLNDAASLITIIQLLLLTTK